APGHEPHESRIALEAGQVASLTVQLVAEPPVVVDPNAPVVRFESTPPGAEVFIDGVSVGVTPMRWAGGAVGQDYAIELRRPGSLSEARALAALEAGETAFSVELEADPMAERVLLGPEGDALEEAEGAAGSKADAEAPEVADSPAADEAAPAEPPAAEPPATEAPSAEVPADEAVPAEGPVTDGAAIERVMPDLIEPFGEDAPTTSRLTVSLVTIEQAVVYVDGTPLPDPAPFTDLEVPAGSHTVRVVNEKAGVDWTTTAEFDVGNTVSLRVTP
ncbi:MAG: PEGA domain-containing protein, partial [Myxococcota bacterium]